MYAVVGEGNGPDSLVISNSSVGSGWFNSVGDCTSLIHHCKQTVSVLQVLSSPHQMATLSVNLIFFCFHC